MCIIIDINAFASVFQSNSADHNDFRPVLEWICKGKGKIVFGGTKYKEELKSAYKYLRIFRQFDAARKLVKIDDQSVDNEQARLESIIEHSDYDDYHIIAIIIVSGCKLICSKDSRAYPYFKNRTLYPKKFERPRIYSNSSNANLLCDRLIADCCKPATKTSKLNALLS